MAKTDLLKTIDERDWGTEQFYQDNTFDPALAKTPDAPTGITATAVVDGILIQIDYTTDTSHDSVANFEAFVVYARAADDTAESAIEVGRIPYGMTSWVWQQEWGGYEGWDIALTGITNTGYESAKSTWYRCVVSTFHDDFSDYGGPTVSALEHLNWLKVATFETDETWVGNANVALSNVAAMAEGNYSLRMDCADSAVCTAYLAKSMDLSVDGRFTADDYITFVLNISHDFDGGNFYIDFSNAVTLINWYEYQIASPTAGKYYVKIKKSEFSEQGSPDWATITHIFIYITNVATNNTLVDIDDLRIVKADPGDADTFNDTGTVWDFNDGTWHVYPGNRAGEPDQAFTLGQIENGAGGDFFFATAQNVRVVNGRLSHMLYFKDADGKAGLHFRCSDDTLGSEDCLAVIADSAADLLYLVKWEAGGDEAVTNQVLNPSGEVAGNFLAWNAATVTRVTTYAYRGTYSYKIETTAASTDGVRMTTAALANAIHYVSFWVYDSITAPTYDPWPDVMVNLDGSNWHAAAVIDTGEGWARYGVQIPAAQANGSTTLYIAQLTDEARTFYVDGIQAEEAEAATAYCDGSLGLGYSWSGTAHESASSRVAGSPITVASAAYTMVTDTQYWLGVDFRDPNHEWRVNVYAATTEEELFQSSALKISDASLYEWPDDGKLGLVAGDCNVRFGEFRAGSPQTADYAHQAGVANVARVAVTFSATEPAAPWAGQIWVDTATPALNIRNAANDGWYVVGLT